MFEHINDSCTHADQTIFGSSDKMRMTKCAANETHRHTCNEGRPCHQHKLGSLNFRCISGGYEALKKSDIRRFIIVFLVNFHRNHTFSIKINERYVRERFFCVPSNFCTRPKSFVSISHAKHRSGVYLDDIISIDASDDWPFLCVITRTHAIQSNWTLKWMRWKKTNVREKSNTR